MVSTWVCAIFVDIPFLIFLWSKGTYDILCTYRAYLLFGIDHVPYSFIPDSRYCLLLWGCLVFTLLLYFFVMFWKLYFNMNISFLVFDSVAVFTIIQWMVQTMAMLSVDILGLPLLQLMLKSSSCVARTPQFHRGVLSRTKTRLIQLPAVLAKDISNFSEAACIFELGWYNPSECVREPTFYHCLKLSKTSRGLDIEYTHTRYLTARTTSSTW